MAKIKGNARMPAPTRENVDALMRDLDELEPGPREEATSFADKVTPKGLFDVLHGMRRWYAGQTMARKLREHHDDLQHVMRLEPDDVVGIFRGFKVPNDHPLAGSRVGDKLTLSVTRNNGLSSWSTSQDATNRFSGGGKGKTGLVVKLVDGKGVTPLLAPPSRTDPWFNQAYEATMGKAYRQTEHEYLVAAPKVRVEVVRVKKAYESGASAALHALKLAGPMGADMPVAPRGEEQSHGTELHPYARTGGPQQDPDMPDWLWDMFGQDNPAPGGAGGQYGTETIG